MTEQEKFEKVAVGPKFRYSPELAQTIEKKWQGFWKENKTFSVANPVGDLATVKPALQAKKKFILDMFPYPSGAGLHVGHTLGFIATDVFARYSRMNQTSVLYTMGFDAFGLPAEQYAIETGTHPRETTQKNINHYLEQIAGLGLSHDINRRVATTSPDFYKWTQWIFLQIFNAWFDESQNKARPISELIAEFSDGKKAVPGGKNWNELSQAEQGDLINDYRLVYQTNSLVNWCPGLGTVLANEEVTADGKSERGNFPVFRKHLKQWMMRITKYADRLDDELADLGWPETIKAMQHNWIGKSTGAYIDFPVANQNIKVFTTRPDTVFGVSYLALNPESTLVDQIIPAAWPVETKSAWTNGAAIPAEAVKQYRLQIAAKSDVERMESKEKTGVFTGAYALHPLTREKIPVFIADYVLPGYGTGAVMGVPAHDERDHDFAEKYALPVVEVVDEANKLINSGEYSGKDIKTAKKEIIAALEKLDKGTAAIQYKLRDWLFARQRYWGEPFPIIFDENDQPQAVPEADLPVLLPDVTDYSPNTFDPNDSNSAPLPPLAKETDWLQVELDLGDGLKVYHRDANVMPQWAGSSWYEIRYIDPHNQQAFVDPANEKYWLGPNAENKTGGVDLYVGGVEHAVLHLLYARFWHKVLYDLGLVTSSEPFHKLFNQGYIQAYAYTDKRGVYVPAAEVTEENGKYYYQGAEVKQEYGKIGKSLKNSVTPDEMFTEYGADTLRVYEMSMGPLDISRPWSVKDIVGAQRFLQRVWRLLVDEESGELRLPAVDVDEETLKLLHKTIKEVRECYENLRFNTAVAKLIELTNFFTKHYLQGIPQDLAEKLVLMLAPLAPHISEELWQKINPTSETITYVDFPEYDEQYITEDQIDMPVQVQGKFRAKIQVPVDVDEATAVAKALADEKISQYVTGEPKRIIFVPNRMINIVL